MSHAIETLFPSGRQEAGSSFTTGILPFQSIRQLVRAGDIKAAAEIADEQIQPASLDLRLGDVAYRVRASFLPGSKATVQEKLDELGATRIDLASGAVLEKGSVYIVPLMEHLSLRSDIAGFCNPKSSTGRLNIFTRVITDHAVEFERVRRGYRGPLYAEISPCVFGVIVRAGSRLNQLRLRRGTPVQSRAELARLVEEAHLLDIAPDPATLTEGSVPMTVDLAGDRESGLIGYRAKKHTDIIDYDRIGHYAVEDYWDRVHASRHRTLILDPDEFYILASRETVSIPPDHAAEMVAYDTLVGEFRVHYAGFFDPGFGYGEDTASRARAVLEVRSHEVPFLLEDGQIVGRIVLERLLAVPEKIYGPSIGSSYQRQGLALSKHFKR
ncbi:MAG: 2'-deoxycytidine 5'-triphosphate deaminase [Alphaproteobacteria bacterium]